MDDGGKKTSANTALIVIGLSLVTIGVSTSDSLEGQTVFGVPGDWISGFLLGSAVALLLIAIVRARKTA